MNPGSPRPAFHAMQGKSFLVITFCLLLHHGCRRPGKEPIDALPSPAESPMPADAGPPVMDEAADAKDAKDAKPQKPQLPVEDAPPIPEYVHERDLKQASPGEWIDIRNTGATEKLMLEGKLVWGRTKTKVKILKRVGDDVKRVIFLGEIDGEGRTIKVQIKVPQESYNEWRGEIHAYNLGKKLGLPLPPVVLRTFKRSDFARARNAMTEEEMEIIDWSGKSSERVEGSVRYWVESLNPRKVGGKVADEEYLQQAAAALHPANRASLVEDYKPYLDLGRMFVFDYLIYNNDRARNLGTMVFPDGSVKLILFDHGLAFGIQNKSKKISFDYLDSMQMLPADMLEVLETMTRPQLDDLLDAGTNNRLRLKETVISQLWDRRGEIVDKAQELRARWGEAAFY
ncbi:MAG: hypothetical protein ABIJ56_08500 [Pseudomonadota bacterium]